MITNNKTFLFCFFLASALLFSSCGNAPTKDESGGTLADIDISQKNSKVKKKETPKKNTDDKKSREEVRNAYRQYVDSASTNDTSRQKALTRLAQLELELSNSISNDQNEENPDSSKSLQRTIELLETTLKDYPKAKGNDKALYQLAIAYDRAGEYERSIARLNTLVQTYPRSIYYAEARFRIAEALFARSDYIAAEDSYTEVIITPGSDKFHEKSLFKRGWTRYKQQFYLEAIDDYVAAVKHHGFLPTNQLEDSEKTQLGEYKRAIGLAFSYEGGTNTIKNYFANEKNYLYLYDTYEMVSDIYLKQERFSDAATILEEYTSYNQYTVQAPIAELKIIETWQLGGFQSNSFKAIENFYISYNPSASYWKQIKDTTYLATVNDKLRKYITLMSAYYHKQYNKKANTSNYQQASIWYERYLAHYTSYVKQDHIYSLYGELLVDAKDYSKALEYFILAAYDGDIILDKSAAYSTIVISAQLADASSSAEETSSWLQKHLDFAQRYVELYPNDKRSDVIASSAAQRAFKANKYQQVIEISNTISDSSLESTRFSANNLKARAYLELKQYADAEAVYLELLDSKLLKGKKQTTAQNSLALAIYRQGESAQKDKQFDIALNNFTRIGKLVPNSPLAATGLYDAIALAMKNEAWGQAAALSEEFKSRYPKSENIPDVTKKLSVAYLKSNQGGKAAKEFEKIATIGDNLEVKKAALWQAAKLYEEKQDVPAAIRAYRDYAHTYKTPYEPYMEAMYKLADLYIKTNEPQKRYFWQTRIRRDDRKATKRMKTERTDYIASTTVLDLARQQKNKFNQRKLVAPIAKNLKFKKETMQESVKLYGQASSYGVQEITTEATNSIGNIYQEFSVALLESERPSNLNDDELDQYEILLEDQAFPFEEKAIEFYETNVARTQEDTHDQWIDKSFVELRKLFPVRYDRKGKINAYK